MPLYFREAENSAFQLLLKIQQVADIPHYSSLAKAEWYDPAPPKQSCCPRAPSGETHRDSKLVFGETAVQCCLLGTLPSEGNGELIHHCTWPVVYRTSQC